MIYPKAFEEKIGFGEVRSMLRDCCLGPLGREEVDSMAFSADAGAINEWLLQVRELRDLLGRDDAFPALQYVDPREALLRLRPLGTRLDEEELHGLGRSLGLVHDMVRHLGPKGDPGDPGDGGPRYPALGRLAEGVVTYPDLVGEIDRILDEHGRMRDCASVELGRIRSEIARAEGSITRVLYGILRAAQGEGLVERDVSPAMRDGRLVIPVTQGLKRKIRGIVHDESSSGKTVFIEPAEVVEANNRVRELEADERREVARILTEFANRVRPHIGPMLASFSFLGAMDLVVAKARLAGRLGATEPEVAADPVMDWVGATHPLLALSLSRQGKAAVPLDITLTPERRILVISGPNAGGKSVCLKTVGLLQYMLQCGLSIPVGERSLTGTFSGILMDIGDEQSIEDDLSTYSSHLVNMRNMMRFSGERSLLLIDEFGSGTEPQIGAAIAEAVLRQFCARKAYGVITTHYQNLKRFADEHDGVVNGAMLYDRQRMSPLFQLSIGNPGSSFAIEIARKTGLPEDVIRDASEIVGSDYIRSDKYLQDIVRDKRYWEGKRQAIRKRERDLEEAIRKCEEGARELERDRKDVIGRAREQAQDLLRESNRRIENAIREIREAQAEREETKRIRGELAAFKAEVEEVDAASADGTVERKMRQLRQRNERKERRRKERAAKDGPGNPEPGDAPRDDGGAVAVGDAVRIKGLTAVGTVHAVDGEMATVIFGGMRTKMRKDRLELAAGPEGDGRGPARASVARRTRETIDERSLSFRQDIDVRGMRGDEAVTAVTYFIDDAILVGVSRVRILHGTGTGILRQLIRQYLSTVPNVIGYRDEHVQFGGAGITVVDIG